MTVSPISGISRDFFTPMPQQQKWLEYIFLKKEADGIIFGPYELGKPMPSETELEKMLPEEDRKKYQELKKRIGDILLEYPQFIRR